MDNSRYGINALEVNSINDKLSMYQKSANLDYEDIKFILDEISTLYTNNKTINILKGEIDSKVKSINDIQDNNHYIINSNIDNYIKTNIAVSELFKNVGSDELK